MITINKDGTKVVIHVSLVELDNRSFPFSFECGQEWVAKMLYLYLSKSFGDRVQEVRREEYESGLKDARKHKVERRDWFMRNLQKRGQ